MRFLVLAAVLSGCAATTTAQVVNPRITTDSSIDCSSGKNHPESRILVQSSTNFTSRIISRNFSIDSQRFRRSGSMQRWIALANAGLI